MTQQPCKTTRNCISHRQPSPRGKSNNHMRHFLNSVLFIKTAPDSGLDCLPVDLHSFRHHVFETRKELHWGTRTLRNVHDHNFFKSKLSESRSFHLDECAQLRKVTENFGNDPKLTIKAFHWSTRWFAEPDASSSKSFRVCNLPVTSILIYPIQSSIT